MERARGGAPRSDPRCAAGGGPHRKPHGAAGKRGGLCGHARWVRGPGEAESSPGCGHTAEGLWGLGKLPGAPCPQPHGPGALVKKGDQRTVGQDPGLRGHATSLGSHSSVSRGPAHSPGPPQWTRTESGSGPTTLRSYRCAARCVSPTATQWGLRAHSLLPRCPRQSLGRGSVLPGRSQVPSVGARDTVGVTQVEPRGAEGLTPPHPHQPWFSGPRAWDEEDGRLGPQVQPSRRTEARDSVSMKTGLTEFVPGKPA
ncbi:PREDICTED: uncharacterized protein LOC102020809 isoform X2 [Chinchilla lanigera]|uniref:uncharacterized protein LOC102020809 isoform X2 n=1 Tax=Chinchilla lanigera TaxID=34839 RepID=UPI0006987A76|nr:PREDICTED: uncharacterized protein LOC102020809 isoform X2 [Chinchilla lanigera]